MSIIKAVQDFLASYPGMELRPLGEVMTDLTKPVPGSYALAPSGNGRTGCDIIGNKTYQNNYTFYARESGSDEADRADNYDFLDGLAAWLEAQEDAGNYPVLPAPFRVETIEIANEILFDISDDGMAIYQIQIKLTISRRGDRIG